MGEITCEGYRGRRRWAGRAFLLPCRTDTLEKRGERKEIWVGRVSNYSSVLIKSWLDWWEIPEQDLPIGGVPCHRNGLRLVSLPALAIGWG